MAELGMKKKEHNWFIDLIKLISCVYVFLDHDIMFNGSGRHNGILNSVVDGSYQWSEMNGDFLGMTGIYSIGFFTFMCGYWFMTAFKKQQKMGIHTPSRTLKLTTNFFGDHLAKYWPALFWGHLTAFLWGIIVYNKLWISKGILGLWTMIRNYGFYLLGIQALGFSVGESIGLQAQRYTSFFDKETGLMIDGTEYMIAWNTSLWYMSAFICFIALWYFVFYKSETFGIYVWIPLNMSMLLGSFSLAGFNTGYTMALNNFIPTEYCRLFGEFAFGVIGWYITDFLKKNVTTEKGKNLLTAFTVCAIIWWFVQSVVGCGGQPLFMLSTMAMLIPILSGNEKFTPFVNKALRHIPLHEHWGTIGLGFFLHQATAVSIIGWINYEHKWAWFESLSFQNQAWLGIAGLFISGCIFILSNKYILSPIARTINKAFRVKETIAECVEEDKLAAAK